MFSAAHFGLTNTECPGGARFIARWLAAAFLVYGLIAVGFLSINIPPFQNPDEINHFQRAAQVAQGGMIGERLRTEEGRFMAGGRIDPGILAASVPFSAELRFHPEGRAKREYWMPPLAWSDERVMENFANTAVYPPSLYLPAVAGVLAGQATGLTVLQTLVLARLCTGVVAVAIGTAAIACAEGAAIWLFAVLTLPMSLVLMAAASQDALLLACCALAATLFIRLARRSDGGGGAMLIGLTLLLSTIAMARPPYVAFALLPLALPATRWRFGASAVVFTLAIFWILLAAAYASSNTGGFVGADPVTQTTALLHDPLLAAEVVFNTIIQSWHFSLVGFIGVIGWSETELPTAYYLISFVALGAAGLAAILNSGGNGIKVKYSLLVVLSLVLATVGIILSIFITWTRPGHDAVEEILGRYYVPLALIGAGALPALGGGRLLRLRAALTLGVAVFPVVSLAVLMRTVILRYYLT